MSTTYKVKFYDPKASRKGRGVRVAFFTNETEAEVFAAGKHLYARPAKVEPVEPLTAEQAAVANAVVAGRRLAS